MNPDRPTPETDAEVIKGTNKHVLVSATFARKLERERDEALATLQYVTGQLIEAGLDDGASPVEKMARRAVVMSKERDQLHAENEKLRASGRFTIGQRVLKTKGSAWSGTVVGTYTTALTPEGYCVESDTHAGSVQIYPANALEAL